MGQRNAQQGSAVFRRQPGVGRTSLVQGQFRAHIDERIEAVGRDPVEEMAGQFLGAEAAIVEPGAQLGQAKLVQAHSITFGTR